MSVHSFRKPDEWLDHILRGERGVILSNYANAATVAKWHDGIRDALIFDDLLSRGDDLNVGCQFGLVQVGQAGQQFSFGEVAGRTEKHDDVRIERVGMVATRSSMSREP